MDRVTANLVRKPVHSSINIVDYLSNPGSFVDDVIRDSSPKEFVHNVVGYLKDMKEEFGELSSFRHFLNTVWSQLNSRVVDYRRKAFEQLYGPEIANAYLDGRLCFINDEDARKGIILRDDLASAELVAMDTIRRVLYPLEYVDRNQWLETIGAKH